MSRGPEAVPRRVEVPDLGGAEEAEVTEVLVAAGDVVAVEQPLAVIETEKASVEMPSPAAGEITAVHIKVGDKIAQGMPVADMRDAAAEPLAEAKPAPESPLGAEAVSGPSAQAVSESSAQAVSKPSAEAVSMRIEVPDMGGAEEAEVTEVCVVVGDMIAVEQPLAVIETEKASVEMPSPAAGEVKAVHIKVGDKIAQGMPVAEILAAPEPNRRAAPESRPPVEVRPEPDARRASAEASSPPASGDVHAGPSVRALAREFGVNLSKIKGSGRHGRILKEDLRDYVKAALQGRGAGLPAVPPMEFADFGPVRPQELGRLERAVAANMRRSWLNVPRVSQFDDADVGELVSRRSALAAAAARRDLKLTPLPFLFGVCARLLHAHPRLNASLHHGGEHIVYKDYVHIGMAVDTPKGLLVPVLRSADRKSLWELAAEMAELAALARAGKLKPDQMRGASFTISSLGAIGGAGFTPVVNTPELAILGVSKMRDKPVVIDGDVVARPMLPLSLSYDHRAVNGADAGRFLTDLISALGDGAKLEELL